jgi:hypothetical protein
MSDALPLAEYAPGHVHPRQSVKTSDSARREDAFVAFDSRENLPFFLEEVA